MRTLVIWFVTAVAVAAAVWIVPGIEMIGPESSRIVSYILFAGILALLNAFLKPLLHTIALPISCLTLGLFALVVNTAVFYLAAWLGNNLFNVGLHIDEGLSGFLSALLASIVISIVVAILNSLIGVKDKRSK
ncbi:MAG: phage holin family protein [Coriobacteriales bacterium]|jgi:putative membrane protein|nr:phage holin family protein [Coriobacteriales bacterium]